MDGERLAELRIAVVAPQLLGAALLVLTVAATRPLAVLAWFAAGIACIGFSFWVEARRGDAHAPSLPPAPPDAW